MFFLLQNWDENVHLVLYFMDTLEYDVVVLVVAPECYMNVPFFV